MNRVFQYIIENTGNGNIGKQAAAHIIRLLKENEVSRDNDIAIVGMAAKLPFAQNTDEFWINIRNGRDCVSDFPEERKKDTDALLGHMNLKPSELEYSIGAFLDEVDKFDYKFFKISPKEASLIDPNQRLFLQTAYQAIEDSGYGNGRLSGSKTGVYVGYSSDFGESYKRFIHTVDPGLSGVAIPGNIKSIIASRISYYLDLKGPSMLVDTACSSSLVAIHMACRAIRNGECETALAGGVKLNLLPLKINRQDGIGITSSDGKARSFDDSSDGTGIGEGCAAILLKPLKKAIADRDNIYAVIKGSAINQDGNSIGITAPNSAAQEEVIVKAWKDAGVNPETISYIEAHGTGTKLGDPLEIDGIESAFKRYTDKKQFCALGTVKTNIGHLDNASGMAGLIKMVMALANKELPPMLHFKRPNRKTNIQESPVYINDRLTQWETDGFPRRCGISSFGLSGTNCHVILEEAPTWDKAQYTAEENTIPYRKNVLTISANSVSALQNYIEAYRHVVDNIKNVTLEDICYTANTGRTHFPVRIAIITTDITDLKQKLAFLTGSNKCNIDTKCIYAVKEYANDHPGISTFENLTHRADTLPDLTSASGDIYNKHLDEICRSYISGDHIQWDKVYDGKGMKKVSLPTYPFERLRCWLTTNTPKAVEINAYQQSYNKLGSPLLDSCITETMEGAVYNTNFQVNRRWVLNEHKVNGNFIVPGTSYIEMVSEAVGHYKYYENLEFKDIIFEFPLAVGENEARDVQTVLKIEDGYLGFYVASRPDGDKWVRHVQGKVFLDEDKNSVQYNPNEMARSAIFEEDIELTGQRKGLIDTGPRWNNLKKVYTLHDGVLAYLVLPNEFTGDLDKCLIHPALMDCAVNVAIGSIGEGLYLPWSYKSLRIYGKMPDKLYSLIRQKGKADLNMETASFDIILMDEKGRVFADIENYTLKKVNQLLTTTVDKSVKVNMFHRMNWIKRYTTKGDEFIYDADKPATGKVLLFKDRGSLWMDIKETLGVDAVEVDIGGCYEKLGSGRYRIGYGEEDYDRLIKDLREEGISKIIHLSSIGWEKLPEDSDSLVETQKRGLYSLVYLIRSLINNKIRNRVELIAVSDYVNMVTGIERRINYYNAAIPGICMVAGQEYGNLNCRCIDIDETTEVGKLVSELNSRDNCSLIAYRDGERYRQELDEVNLEDSEPEEIEICEKGVYIITGGLGGIGREFARYLSAKKPVSLVLIARTHIPDREAWDEILEENRGTLQAQKIEFIKAIEKSGSQVMYYSADVSDETDMKNVLSNIRRKYGRINGVIHAAGVAGNGFIIRKDMEVFDNVVKPKVQGTFILDMLTKEDNLDFFIMFSSINSILGGAGQSDYTAANSFMDAFADYRRKTAGGKTVSINWTAWKETGMAFDNGIINGKIRGVFLPATTSDAIQMFEEITAKKLTRIIAGQLDFETIPLLDSDTAISFSNKIQGKIHKHKVRSKTDSQRNTIREVEITPLRIKGSMDKGTSSVQAVVARIWAGALGLEEVSVYDNFNDLGGDSIMATLLLKDLEKEFPGIVDISDIFNYPSISAMSEYIESRTGKEEIQPDIEEQQIMTEDGEAGMEEIMQQLSRGEITIEEADKLMKSIGLI